MSEHLPLPVGYHSQRCNHCDHIRAAHSLTPKGCLGHALPGRPGADCACSKFEGEGTSMTEHLPECTVSRRCICDELRACEARVREDHSSGMTEAYQRGLNAMSDAVAGCTWDRGVSSEFDATVSAVLAKTLATIDALREKP